MKTAQSHTKLACLALFFACTSNVTNVEPTSFADGRNTATPDELADGGTVNVPDANNGTNSPDGGKDDPSDGASNNPPDVDPRLANWCMAEPADFSFFVTSMDALWALSDSTPGDLQGGFGGNFGGIAGADTICQTIGTAAGHGDKTWRAFLSATDDGSGNPVHAIERIGEGPWVDANGRTVATGISGLLSGNRPDGDLQSTNDLPDECGVPLSALGDAHDVVTASNERGMLATTNPEYTCNDWTADSGGVGSGGNLAPDASVRCGHSFPRSARSGRHWMSDHGLRGCDKGANLQQDGAGSGTCIGCTGGYGAIYCFAL